MAKPICVLPWVHLYVGTSGEVQGCSKWPNHRPAFGNTAEHDLTRLWESAEAEELRAAMLKGSPPQASCQYCNTLSSAGVEPYWKRENRNFPEAFEAGEWEKGPKLVGNARPTFIEFRFSNLCNLRCRTCGPRFSTAWYGEGERIYGESHGGGKPTHAFPDHARYLRFIEDAAPHLKVLQFLGGEPLIHDELYLLLEKLAALGREDVSIKVTTNFTKLRHKSWDFLELAGRFKKVHLSISLDGVGERSEYIRKGSRWAEIERNFEWLRRFPAITFNLYPCISVLNAFHLPDAIDRWIELGMVTAGSRLFTNFVTEWPAYYNLRILDTAERAQLSGVYLDYLLGLQNRKDRVDPRVAANVSGYLREILMFLNGGSLPEKREEFRQVTRALDQSRNESFPSVFPELSSLYLEPSADATLGASHSATTSWPNEVR